MTPITTLPLSPRAKLPAASSVMIIAGIAPPSVTGIDWIAGLPVICDSDPRDGLSFPCQRSFPSLHGDVSEEDAFPGEVAQKNDVVVVGDVVSFVHFNLSHSKAPPRCSNQRSTDPWDVSSLAAGHFIPSINLDRSK